MLPRGKAASGWGPIRAARAPGHTASGARKSTTGDSLWYAWAVSCGREERGVRIFYGWIIVGAAFVTWAISLGPRQAYSVFLLSFVDEFGWSRGLAAGAFSVHMVFYALGGLALGILVDRTGPRRVIAYSTAGGGGVPAAGPTGHWRLRLADDLPGIRGAGGRRRPPPDPRVPAGRPRGD